MNVCSDHDQELETRIGGEGDEDEELEGSESVGGAETLYGA